MDNCIVSMFNYTYSINIIYIVLLLGSNTISLLSEPKYFHKLHHQ